MIEIIFLILGIIVFIVSFLLPAGKKEDTESTAKISEDAIREMVDREIENRKAQINEIVDETVAYSMEKAERSMERLTNEKMMAVSEYSDTVLGEINKNHQEVVFLYDMLNDKHESLTTVAGEAAKTASEVKQTMLDADLTAKEIEIKAKEVRQAASEAESRAQEAQQALNEVEIKTNELLKKVDETAISTAKFKEETESISRSVMEMSAKVQKTEAEKTRKDGFKPINAEVIEAINMPVDEVKEEEKPKTAGKTARKPRVSKTSKKSVKTAEPVTETESVKILPTDAVSAGVPEVAVSLNEEGNAGGRNNNERILELHNTGKSNMAIAKELGLGIGEVKLVIDLFEGM